MGKLEKWTLIWVASLVATYCALVLGWVASARDFRREADDLFATALCISVFCNYALVRFLVERRKARSSE